MATDPTTALGRIVVRALRRTGWLYFTRVADIPRAPVELDTLDETLAVRESSDLTPVVVGRVCEGPLDSAVTLEAEKLPFTAKWSPVFGLSLRPTERFRIVEVRPDGTRAPCTWLEYRRLNDE